MKTKIYSVLLTVFLVVGFSAGVCSAKDKVYRLKMQSYYPVTMIDGDKNFAKNVEAMSNGRIKITVFAGGELVASSNILKSVKAGMIDIAHGTGSYFSELKIGNIEAGLPMGWQNAVEAELLFEQMGLQELVAAEYAKYGVHYISPTYAAPYNILAKTPLNSVDDLKKVKLRAIGGPSKMLNKVGCATVYLPPEDMYLALSTGQIDGVLYGGAFEYQTMKFYEVAKYYNKTSVVNPLVDSIFINQKLWNSLPDDLKAIIKTAARQARWDYYTWILSKEYSLVETVFKDATNFSEADVEKLTAAAVEVWDEEGAKSPECAKAVELVKKLNRTMGRLK